MPPITNEEEPMGIDSVISKVDKFMTNPKMITRKDLQEIKEDLMDIKGFMDGDEEGEEMEEKEESPDKPGLVIMIGKKMKRGGKE